MGEAAALISGVMATLVTPSSIFIFLNLVIGTIFIRSRFGAPIKQIQHLPKLIRSPSLLHPTSSSFNNLQHEQTECAQPELVPTPTPTPTVPSPLKRVKSFNFALYNYKLQPSTHPQTELDIQRPNPDNNPQEPQLPRVPSLLHLLHSVKVSCLKRPEESIHGDREREMEDSDSENEGLSEEEEEEEGVDAKADDFINMFKNQLRLQRVDSNLSYKLMLEGN